MASILYNIIISPIELVVEIIFEIIFRVVGQGNSNQGLAVIGVSIAISLLTLPLYARADAVQKKARDIQEKLSYWTSHIKKNFKGDERFMMLQAYYRENGYSPLQALNGSISLLLEIPFFIAAYHFLSNLALLKGISFGPIADLGRPDELIKIGSISINILPVLMTGINCISSAIYLKGFQLRDKIQTYGMALIFLVLLYNSPSGLVVYWTCNNIFSLVKNIFYRLKNPKKTAAILCAVFGVLLSLSLIFSGILNSRKKYAAVFLFMVLTCIPLLLLKNKAIRAEENKKSNSQSSILLFILPSIIFVLLTGLLIPCSLISASPQEFIAANDFKNPLSLLKYPVCHSTGFILWAAIVYLMSAQKVKDIIKKAFITLAIISVADHLFFTNGLGIISAFLVYDSEPQFSKFYSAANLFIIIIIALGTVFAYGKKNGRILSFACIVLIICLSVLSGINITKIQKEIKETAHIENNEKFESVFHLSRSGKNVIVFMLDRAINGFFPLCLEEKEILQKQFSGFTYYPNTISFGAHTIFGSPALFGGYEYTPLEINRRDRESLCQKQNEALKVLPVLFLKNSFDVTVCDAPLANYKSIPDLSIYNDYPKIKTYLTTGKYRDAFIKKYSLEQEAFKSNERNLFLYSVFRSAPIFLKDFIYDDGLYLCSKENTLQNPSFIDNCSVLEFLPEITEITDKNENTFCMIDNETAHNPIALHLPDYTITPSENFPQGHENPQIKNRQFETRKQLESYHANMAAFLALGRWFDFMRQNGVYDNTRIIIVADHGYTNDKDTMGLMCFKDMIFKNPKIDLTAINPLLLVKDFYSGGLTVCNDFMTNADTPSIAFKNLIEKPVNPFTGKAIDSTEKTARPQHITLSHNLNTYENNTNTFNTSDAHWYSVHDNIFDESNWEQLD